MTRWVLLLKEEMQNFPHSLISNFDNYAYACLDILMKCSACYEM